MKIGTKIMNIGIMSLKFVWSLTGEDSKITMSSPTAWVAIIRKVSKKIRNRTTAHHYLESMIMSGMKVTKYMMNTYMSSAPLVR